MSHIFKPGDKVYWHDPEWGVDRLIELIANNNGEEKSIFPLIGTFPITKPLSERMQVYFTKDGGIRPFDPPVLFVNNPFDENPVKFKSGDKAFYLPSKRWVDIISCDTHSVKDYYYTLREYDEDGKSLTIHTFNIQSDTNGFKDSTPIFLDHNPFDKNDPNNPSSCTDECKEEKDADYFLNKAVEILKERGRERDVEKERSMARIVSVYNALTGQSMSVEDGWKFMAILKLVRIQIKPHEDGFLDALSYIALWGEEYFNNETTKGD